MKKIFCVVSLFIAVTISGCFEIATETSINEDGSGIYTYTIDMSNMMGMLKMMGEEAKDLDSLKKDTLISLAYIKDSLENLTATEKRLLTTATLKILFNTSDEKMLMIFSFPFNQPSEMAAINSLLTRSGQKVLSKELESFLPNDGQDERKMEMGNDQNSIPGIEAYFDYSNEAGKMSKKINQAKYADILNDPLLKNMQEMSLMGSPMSLKTVINLPRPVKKAEGKGLLLSADKKKVTIEATIDDFFEHPEKLEYEIEY